MSSKLWRRWKAVALRVGRVQSWVIYSLFYLIVVPLVALPLKIWGDPLRLKKRTPSYWNPLQPNSDSLEEARRQF